MAWILFYDGECGFCIRSIRCLANLDKQGRIHYAPLQGRLAKLSGFESHLQGTNSSLVIINEDEGKVYTQSDGILQILQILGGAWRLLGIFGFLPMRWRNALYRLVANNRHRIGASRLRDCDMPDEELRSRLRD